MAAVQVRTREMGSPACLPRAFTCKDLEFVVIFNKMPLSRILKGLQNLERAPELASCRRLIPEWRKLAGCYIGIKTLFPFTITLPSGSFCFETISDVRTFWVVWFANSYPVLRSDRLIVDAGANIGTFTLFALLRAPQCHVIAIEPAPDTFERLEKMITAHGFADRCTLLRAALGSTRGTTYIDLGPQSQFRRTGRKGHLIDVLTLNEILKAPVDFLKMDIEGSELETVSVSEPLRYVRRLALEFHPPVLVDHLTDKLSECGFITERVRHDGQGYGLVWASLPSN